MACGRKVFEFGAPVCWRPRLETAPDPSNYIDGLISNLSLEAPERAEGRSNGAGQAAPPSRRGSTGPPPPPPPSPPSTERLASGLKKAADRSRPTAEMKLPAGFDSQHTDTGSLAA